MKKLLTYLVMLFLILAFASPAIAADVTLAWDANTEPEVIGYRLHWSTVNAIPFTDNVDVKKITQYTITGLSIDTTYFFAATAYSLEQESEYSDILEYVVKPGRVIIRIIDRPDNLKIEWGK